METNNYTMRTYKPSDYEMLCGWWYAHGKPSRPEIFLPKCGVVCEFGGRSVAALFLHMDNSCGMCMAEHAVSAPKLPLRVARTAFLHCIACLKEIATGFGYHTISVFTKPAIAGILARSSGFTRVQPGLVQMVAKTQGGAP
ncbi:MAG: hypothetical protein KGR46_10910 [Verrucomicrobia bacterium]|nr:hypothetical protein [Verrucomicrobiota bacterium]